VGGDAPSSLILIDASALIALLAGEPAADDVRALLSEGSAAMATLNLAEAIDRLERRYGLSSARTRPVSEGLVDKALTLVPLGTAEAWRAAELRAARYHRTKWPLSLADAVLIASAGADGRIATSDRYVLVAAASEGVAVTPLLDSRARRPTVE
jgi:predicted nucleic acid-binding protein